MPSSPYAISTWSPSSSSEPLHKLYQSTVASSHPPYSLPAEKFHTLVTAPLSTVFIATTFPQTSSTTSEGSPAVGFALTYLIRFGSESAVSGQHYKGSLALLCASPLLRNHGVGTALHSVALDHLEKAVKGSLSSSTPPPPKGEIQLGSIFPRIFPGLPEGPEFEKAKAWFGRRGWVFKDSTSIDLYQSLIPGHPPDLEELMGRAKEHGFTFGPPKPEDDEGLYELEKTEFDSFTGWPDMFPALICSGHRDDIECAFDRRGKVVGATVAALGPPSGSLAEEGPMHRVLAWPCTLGHGCGIIACVGISFSTRNSGAGIAMVASAVIRLAQRGADGCFVDWVSLKGFYERARFGKWERGYYEASRTVEELVSCELGIILGGPALSRV